MHSRSRETGLGGQKAPKGVGFPCSILIVHLSPNNFVKSLNFPILLISFLILEFGIPDIYILISCIFSSDRLYCMQSWGSQLSLVLAFLVLLGYLLLFFWALINEFYLRLFVPAVYFAIQVILPFYQSIVIK